MSEGQLRHLRRRKTITTLVIACAAIALGFIAQGYLIQHDLIDGLVLYGIAVVMLIFCRPYDCQTVQEHGLVRPCPRSPLRFVLSFVFILTSAMATVFALNNFRDGGNLPHAWTYHLASGALFMAGVYLLDGRPASNRLRRHISWQEIMWLLAILGIGAFMRLYRFSSWPYGTWYDEADNGLHVIRMLQDPTYRPVFVPSTNLPAHFLYLILLSFTLFGISTLSIRAVTVFLGLAGVVAAYLFGREMFDRRLALVLAFLIAVSRWDINFSRVGLHGISTPLFELLVLYFLLRGLRTHRWIHFAWAGAFTGLGLCFYAPFRLFPFVLILYLLRLFLADRAFLRQYGLNLVIFGTAALITFAPVLQYMREHPEEFWARTNKVSIFSSQPADQTPAAILRNARMHLLMFNYQGDPNGRHNLPGAPMLDYVTSALFAIGLGYSLYHIRNLRYWLLITWLGMMLCGGIFSLPFEAPQSLRAIGALPAAYALAVVPLSRLQTECLRTFPRRGPVLFLAGVLILLAYIGVENYHTYFNIQARNFSSWSAYSTRETIMAQEYNRLDRGYAMYFAPVLTNHLTTEFLAPTLGVQRAFDPALHLPFRDSGPAGIALFIDADSFGLIDLLRTYYPGLEARYFGQDENGQKVLALVLISREEVESIQGLPARYYHEEGPGSTPLYRQDPTINFNWEEDSPIGYPFNVEWRGVLAADEYGTYGVRLIGSLAEAAEVQLDGVSLFGSDKSRQRKIVLAQGRHEVRIRAHVAKAGSLRLEWQLPGREWQVVPRRALFGPPVTANGLVGRYYPNARWEAPPAKVQIDPEVSFYFHLIPLQRPYTVEWVGQIEAPTSGTYGFGIECRDAAWLAIDGVEILNNQIPDRLQDTTVSLTAGRHDLRIRFLDQTDHSHVYFYWTPPGMAQSIVPYTNLFPQPGGGWEPAP